MTFDLSQCERDENGHWKAQTKDGRPVRILCADRKGNFPICGLISEQDGGETFDSWTDDGKWTVAPVCSPADLINPPRKQTVTVEIWRRPSGSFFVTEAGNVNHQETEASGYKLAKTLTTEIEVP